MPLILETKNLCHIYNQGTSSEKKALSGINISVENGEFVGIIGHTGSGKSTLVQHFNALLKPTSGQAFFNGEDIFADKSKLKTIRQKVGLVFQYPEHQLFELSVKEDVAFGPKNMGLSKEETEIRVAEALKAVGLDGISSEKSPFELSGGQKRRAAIAGVLAMKPEVLILDEPAAGLDPRGRNAILESIRTMHKELNITVVLVSHSMEDIGRLVDRIIVINQGEIAMTGTPGEVFKNARLLEEMDLAAPQAAYLMEKMAEKGFLPSPEQAIYSVSKAVEAIAGIIKKI